MMNDGRRWLSILAFFLGSILWIVPWTDPNGWGQEPSSSAEAPSSPSDERPAEETPTPSQEILAPLDEAPPSAPGTLAVPTPEAPTGTRKYTVKTGDTLWGISNAYLRDSFLWPKLWKNNQHILNPDLIYPGNIIELPGNEASQQAALVETAQPMPTPRPQVVEKQAPMEVEKAVETEIHQEEAATAPTVKPSDQAFFAASGYILTGQRAAGIVVGARDGRELIGQHETAYLLPQNGPQPHVGDRYTLYRIVRKVYHPKTGKYFGDLIRILGLAEVIGANPNEKTVSAMVLTSYDSIQKGDSLMPAQDQDAASDLAAPAASSNNPLQGFIVEVKENRVSQSQFDVVYLDRGLQDGVRSGDRFTIVRDGEKTGFFSPGKGVQLPQRIIGELQVILAQDSTSTAKVIQSTEVIFKGDRFETRPAP
ncbi:MAG: LysM peptidoglycan-binding domain-containing protein [Nitrospirae bacterium]|nr:LysM peptidoglycan-binding domain-containing protein [Nitrospirota bacterium]